MWRYLQLGRVSFSRYRLIKNKLKTQSTFRPSVIIPFSFVIRRISNDSVSKLQTKSECRGSCRHYSSEKIPDNESPNVSRNRTAPVDEKELVNITFVTDDGEEIKVKAKVGDNILKLAVKHDVGAEGACGGELSCTTCHMYVDENYYDQIEGPSVREEDLLDIAKFLKPNSRLVCQITVTKELEGLRLTLPPGTVNFYVDDYKPTHH